MPGLSPEFDLLEHLELEDSRVESVVEIVVRIGDLAREIRDLGFQMTLSSELWNGDRMRFEDRPEANVLLGAPYREGWT